MNKCNEILSYLNELFPNPKCELNYKNTFELVIAVALSAQCTDKRVNETTKVLFEKYPTPLDLMNAKLEDVEECIKKCGMYHQKAKNIISLATDIVNNFNGNVPNTLEELTTLAGVGRKTASVVLVEGFSVPAMPVDTHIFRVSKRLGLSNGKDVLEVEKDLKGIYPSAKWYNVHISMVLFGRYVCKAIKPQCDGCKLKNICNYYKEKN